MVVIWKIQRNQDFFYLIQSKHAEKVQNQDWATALCREDGLVLGKKIRSGTEPYWDAVSFTQSKVTWRSNIVLKVKSVNPDIFTGFI